MPTAKKEDYNERLQVVLNTYTRMLVVHADNVGSKQFQTVRAMLRLSGDAEIVMGKNTQMRRAIRENVRKGGNKALEGLLPHMVGNVGLVCLKEKADIKDVVDRIRAVKVGALAKVGVVATCDVTIPAGGTGMDPSQTAYFQILNIPTKINKGQVEIVGDQNIIKKGDRVGPSESALCTKMGLRPFSYALQVLQVFEDSNLYDPMVLDLTDEDLSRRFGAGVSNVASISLAAGYPTLASVPHSIINSFKNVLSIALGTDYSFPVADKIKDMLANPGAFAAAPAGGGGGNATAAAPEPEEEEEEEDMGFSLFD